ncbi:MAG: cytochrome c family protein [Opitutus sp.]
MSARRIIGSVLFSLVGLATSALAGTDNTEVNRGQHVFAACAACHAPDQPAKLGPDLRSVVGRKAGSRPDFRYSRAMKNAKIVWSEETLDEYLADPQQAIPGNAMPYPGISDESQRRAVIAYLKTLK